MKEIQLDNHSVYFGFDAHNVCENFFKLYKGVKVSCYMNLEKNPKQESKFAYFSIRYKKDIIWKRSVEPMKKLVFDDASCSIFCDFENLPENKSRKVLYFDKDVYEELKKNIPIFMWDQGCKFKYDVKVDENGSTIVKTLFFSEEN